MRHTEQSTTIQGQGRRTVRHAVQALLRLQPHAATAGRWPDWAAAPADGSLLSAIDSWLAADLDGREELLRSKLDDFTGPHAVETLAIAQQLHPEDTGLTELLDAVETITDRGLPAGLARYRDEAEHRRLFDKWNLITDAASSLEFLRQHPSLSSDPRTSARLATRASFDSVPASLHQLTDHVELDDLAAAIADPDAAEDLILRLIDAGDLRQLTSLLNVLPDHVLSPERRAETAALAALATDPPDIAAARRQMRALRDLAGAERHAFTVSRLRLLSRRHPHLCDHLTALTEILTLSTRPGR